MARTKATKRKKGDHSAQNMLRAIHLNRRGMSVRKAAKECNVFYPTLQRYIKKHASVSDFNLKNQRLTPNYNVNKTFTAEQEETLDEYIQKCALQFYGLTSKDVRKIAYQMAKLNTIKCPASWEREKMAGLEWLRSFRSRHANLSLKKPEACSLARVTAFNRETVKTFFNNLKNVMNRHHSFGTGCRVYNLDETATTTVQKPQKVMAPKGRHNIGKITSGEKGTLVTTCAIVCAAGHALPPVLVFPRKNYKDYMLNGAPPGSLGLATPTGWMNSELFVQVMQHFIIHTSASPENPALLIMDNHESHLSLEALNLAKQSGVTVLTLHPHTTAKMQPLDVEINGLFKTYYNSAADSWLMRNPGKPLTIYNVAACVGEAYAKAMTPTNIASAFNKCGIFPYNENVFTDVDFLPSAVMDREQPRVPSEVPAATAPRQTDFENPDSPVSDITYAESPVLITDDLHQTTSANEKSHAESPSLLESYGPMATEVTSRASTPRVCDRQDIELSLQMKKQPLDSERVTTTPDKGTPTSFLSPKDFMPNLRAAPRTGTRKPRKHGKSMIVTDTPEKNQIAEERQKAQKRNAAHTVKRPVLTGKKFEAKKRQISSDKKYNKTKMKKPMVQSDSETSDEGDEEVCISETDLSATDNEDLENEFPLITENFGKLVKSPEKGDYILVLFDTKKINVYYVGNIIEAINANAYEVSFMRLKLKDCMKFVMPKEPDISEVHIRDVKMILPRPQINGSKTRSSTYVFPIRVSPKINLR